MSVGWFSKVWEEKVLERPFLKEARHKFVIFFKKGYTLEYKLSLAGV